jgi:hypothetical protein
MARGVQSSASEIRAAAEADLAVAARRRLLVKTMARVWPAMVQLARVAAPSPFAGKPGHSPAANHS